MDNGNRSMASRRTLTALAGLVTLSLASCDSPPANQSVGGSSSVGGTSGATGGTTTVTETTMADGGSTNVGETTAVGGITATGGTTATTETTAVGGTTAGGTSTTLSWSFVSDTESWVAANASTFSFYSGSDSFCAAGCAQLTGELTSNGASYNARIVFDEPMDLSGGVSISAKVKYIVPTGSDDFGTIAIYAQDGEPVTADDDNWANGAARGNKATAGGLADPAGATLQFNLPASKVSAETTLSPGGTAKQGFNPASIHLIGIVVVSGSASQVGTTTFLVDSVTITKP